MIISYKIRPMRVRVVVVGTCTCTRVVLEYKYLYLEAIYSYLYSYLTAQYLYLYSYSDREYSWNKSWAIGFYVFNHISNYDEIFQINSTRFHVIHCSVLCLCKMCNRLTLPAEIVRCSSSTIGHQYQFIIYKMSLPTHAAMHFHISLW